MPVTARLSQKFYERFGEDIATELVDWFNAVDATYRADLRELNELNFQRFDAKLEQRLAQLDSKWEQRFAGLNAKWEQRFASLEAKLEAGLAMVRSEFHAELRGLRAEFAAKLDTGLSGLRAEMLKWMFLFWVGTVIPLAGLMVLLAGR
jgi:hypothetical protein